MRKLEGSDFRDVRERFEADWRPQYDIFPTKRNMQVLVDAHNELVDEFNDLVKELAQCVKN